MKFSAALLLPLLASISAFQTAPSIKFRTFSRPTTSLNIVAGDDEDVLNKVLRVFEEQAGEDTKFDKIVKSKFPDALSNRDFATRVVKVLAEKGFSGSNTLLCTSLCCDELARRLEDDFNRVYGNNFNLGGLSGFPFAGNTGFGAMAAHIPDDGNCLVLYGPHVGISADGTVGKVEREGIELVDNCCGSAIAASNYLSGITDGGAPLSVKLQVFSDFQQNAVQELILPYGKRLKDAPDRMMELPYALYEVQDILMREIVDVGSSGIKKGFALIGGIQINTGPDTLDFFHPLRFDYMNSDGEILEDMLPLLADNEDFKLTVLEADNARIKAENALLREKVALLQAEEDKKASKQAETHKKINMLAEEVKRFTMLAEGDTNLRLSSAEDKKQTSPAAEGTNQKSSAKKAEKLRSEARAEADKKRIIKPREDPSLGRGEWWT